MKNYEDELEILMLHNPRGGRPQKPGATVFTQLEPKNSWQDLSEIREDTSMRMHLGYCQCGIKKTIGEKRGLLLIKILVDKLGVTSIEDLEARVLRHVMRVEENKDELRKIAYKNREDKPIDNIIY